MTDFVTNPVQFSAKCAREGGICTVVRENFLFLEEGKETEAVTYLRMKCGQVVFIPDAPYQDRARLYHTSCQRMTDVISQIFGESLLEPTRLQQPPAEMTLGELHRRCVTMPYAECRRRVGRFNFS